MAPLLLCAASLVCVPPAGAGKDAARDGEAGLEYRIGPEDVLQIAVWKNESLSRTVPVRPDGMISLPLLNDVRAAGLTPLELRQSLIQKLVEYAPSPEVSVIVTEVRSFKVSVMGSVARPGRFDAGTWITLLDALAMAGGLTEFADRSGILVLRRGERGTERLSFDYSRVGRDRGAQVNFHLHPGDVVVVP